MRRPERYTFHLHSPAATRALARAFAAALASAGVQGRSAAVVGLAGNLGTGKTFFVKACARALGIRRHVASPTFLVVRRYPLRRSPFSDLFHVDAYRIRRGAEAGSLGLKEVFSDPHHLVFVEWAPQVRRLLPTGTLWISLAHGRGPRERVLTFSPSYPRP